VSLRCGDGEGVSEKGVHTFANFGPVLTDVVWVDLLVDMSDVLDDLAWCSDVMFMCV
jgi:hypothetical protein